MLPQRPYTRQAPFAGCLGACYVDFSLTEDKAHMIKKTIPWLLPALLLAFFHLPSCNAFEWRTDLATAANDAKTSQKLLLLDFSGSDWCGWCKKLDAEVFATQAFQNFAASNLVCIQADFPRLTKQTPELQAQNERLMNYFQVEGFPTLLVFNSDAELIGQLSYQPGGPEAFIQALQQIRSRAQMRNPNLPPGPKLPLQ